MTPPSSPSEQIRQPRLLVPQACQRHVGSRLEYRVSRTRGITQESNSSHNLERRLAKAKTPTEIAQRAAKAINARIT